MTNPSTDASQINRKFLFAFNIDHSSIGWAAMDTSAEGAPVLQGSGTVLFPPDDCLAVVRRRTRRLRRQIRSTRTRIARMKKLLAHLGVLTMAQLDEAGGPWPWKLAARVHANGALLSWPELWDVLRWYAHNRGYDGNRNWSRDDTEDAEDTGNEKAALALMEKFGKPTMCQTICAKLQIDPLSEDAKSSPIAYKTSNAAFPRDIVLNEVMELLNKHVGKLPEVTPVLINALCAENNTAGDGMAVSAVFSNLGFEAKLPARFVGGLLFGQAVPRFDNRSVGECPISGEKRPLKNCREFLEFRWAEILANVTVRCSKDVEMQPLTIDQRAQLTDLARMTGGFSAAKFKNTVLEVCGAVASNAELLMTSPEAEEALTLDPARRLLQKNNMLKAIWSDLPACLQKRIMGRWNKRRRVTWRWILLQPEAPGTLEAKLKAVWIGMKRKLRQGDAEPVWEDSVRQSIAPVSIGGRAPYSRTVMMLAVEQVQQGRHPHEAGGVLEITEEIRERVRRKEIDELTNNHLVRHRIKMLLRLMDDMVKNYAGGDSARVDQCVIEVARDLLEFSGKNNQEITQALGFKLKNFKDVSKKLSSDLVGTSIPVVAGLIRKARIADDLNWVCPYTGVAYDARTLACGNVDKDHIIPRSLCPTDSLDSLVVTFDAVNKWKANRTAWRFVEEEQGKQVPGRPDLSILSLRQFAAFVDKLAAEKKPGRFTPGPGSLDDKLRRWRRKQRLLIKDYEERDLSQRDIEVTSHVVRLCKQQLEKRLPHLRETGRIRALPACVTSTVRKSWNCFSCLIPVCPEVAINLPLVNEQGRFDLIGKEGRVLSMQLRPRAEIRRITHLYQALEACIAAYATILLPDAGKLWEQLVIRKIRPNERAEFEQLHGWNKMLKLISSSRVPGGTATMKLFVDQLPDKFKKQITARLRERRVIHHVPADMSGARLEMNTWRIVETDGDQVTLTQRSCNKLDIDPETGARKRTRKEAKMKSRRIVGLKKGKLSALKAALVIAENYGVALEPRITVVTFHQVKKQLDALREFNGGRPVRVIRNGMLIRVASGTRKGTWRVISVKSTEAYGVALNLATPDGVQLAKGNAPIASLIENGLEILNLSFCGY